MCELKIIFPSDEHMKAFATWLSDGGGEQQYFDSYGEELRFNYHPENQKFGRDDKRRYGKFLEDNVIRVTKIDE